MTGTLGMLVLAVALPGCLFRGSSEPSLPPPQPPSVPAGDPEIALTMSHVDLYPQREVVFDNGVRGIADVVYSRPAGFRPLALDLYLPPSSMPQPAAGFPLVVQIHGGAWTGGDRRHSGPIVGFPEVLAQIAARGYVIASIDYRLSSEAQFPAQVQDVKAAIRWLRANSDTYGIDPSRAVTWGESGGAYLAALASLGCNAPPLDPEDALDASDCVQGSIAWFGVFDMATIAEQARKQQALTRDEPDAPEWRLLGCMDRACLPERLAMASPISYVDAHDPPMLLIVGDDDHTVPHAQTLEMADRLDAVGVAHSLIVLPGIDHGFFGASHDATRAANLRALAATTQFIDRILRK